jgi:hypothetical protein
VKEFGKEGFGIREDMASIRTGTRCEEGHVAVQKALPKSIEERDADAQITSDVVSTDRGKIHIK